MVEIDLYFVYSLAVQARGALFGFTSRPSNIVAMSNGAETLKNFIDSSKQEFLPKSKAHAKEIVSILTHWNTQIQLAALDEQTLEIPEEQFGVLAGHIANFERQLQDECRHLYVLGIEDQRLLTAYVLIEKIENAVSKKTWKYMSKIARREMEESGKCLAVERDTACGFHILRCVESIVREYIEATGHAFSNSDRNWGKYVEILKQKNAADEVTSIVDNLRRDDRNTLMHPERFLNVDEAIGLFNLCQTALDRLITDMEKHGLAREFVGQEHNEQKTE